MNLITVTFPKEEPLLGILSRWFLHKEPREKVAKIFAEQSMYLNEITKALGPLRITVNERFVRLLFDTAQINPSLKQRSFCPELADSKNTQCLDEWSEKNPILSSIIKDLVQSVTIFRLLRDAHFGQYFGCHVICDPTGSPKKVIKYYKSNKKQQPAEQIRKITQIFHTIRARFPQGCPRLISLDCFNCFSVGCYIQMPYVGESFLHAFQLRELGENRSPLSSDQYIGGFRLMHILMEMLEALKSLQGFNIIHGRLDVRHFVLNQGWDVTMISLDNAYVACEKTEKPRKKPDWKSNSSLSSTYGCEAPEQIFRGKASKSVTCKADVFAVGVIFLCLMQKLRRFVPKDRTDPVMYLLAHISSASDNQIETSAAYLSRLGIKKQQCAISSNWKQDGWWTAQRQTEGKRNQKKFSLQGSRGSFDTEALKKLLDQMVAFDPAKRICARRALQVLHQILSKRASYSYGNLSAGQF